jgi:hypothetical protein
MRSPYHSAKRSLAIFLLAMAGVSVFASFQQRKLATLREEIASAKRGDMKPRAASLGKDRDRVITRDDAVAEVRGLLDVLAEPDGPEFAGRKKRLAELLAGLDAHGVRRLLEETGEAGERGVIGSRMRELFAKVNPRESFRLGLDDPPGVQSKDDLFRNFAEWAAQDPSGALRWYREAKEKDLPLAKEKRILIRVLAAQARLDPKRAIQEYGEHFGEETGETGTLNIERFVDGLRNRSERMAFMVALNKDGRTSPDQENSKLRDSLVLALSSDLVIDSFEEASAVVDGTFTEEERKKFAMKLVNSHLTNKDAWPQWARWIVALNLPAERGQPLANMAADVARERDAFKDPRWLAELPAGPQRDLAVEVYAMVSLESDIQESIRWLNYLPAGERRRNVAGNAAYYLKMKDPEAAEALRKREGLQ